MEGTEAFISWEENSGGWYCLHLGMGRGLIGVVGLSSEVSDELEALVRDVTGRMEVDQLQSKRRRGTMVTWGMEEGAVDHPEGSWGYSIGCR
ncbi:uncharacterized [Tachysurus ichikawai]